MKLFSVTCRIVGTICLHFRRPLLLSCKGDRDNSVGIATRYGLDISSFEFRWRQEIFFSSRPSRSVLGSTQPPVKLVPVLFIGGTAPRIWHWPSTPPSAEIWSRPVPLLSPCAFASSYGKTSPLPLHLLFCYEAFIFPYSTRFKIERASYCRGMYHGYIMG